MGKKRLTAEELNVPEIAHLVPKGYPVTLDPAPAPWTMGFTVYGPVMSWPRTRMSAKGTFFLPSDYRKHSEALSNSMAFARGLWESEHGHRFETSRPIFVDIAFWSVKLRGDLDNLAKTVLDAGQLSRGEPDGAQLWDNDNLVHGLYLDFVPTEDEQWEQTVIRITNSPLQRIIPSHLWSKV